MKLNCFEFDGEGTLSAQKNDRVRTPYIHRNGPPLPGAFITVSLGRIDIFFLPDF